MLSTDWYIRPRSIWRGIQAMTPNRDRASINTGIDLRPPGNTAWGAHAWTPTWHEGRGPYISIRLHRLHIYRGY